MTFTPMEKMEIFLHTLNTSKFNDTVVVKQEVYDNSGLFVRSIEIKAGDALIGKIHREWNVNILASGSMYITNNPEDKTTVVRVDAPFVFETGPGSQKFGVCITDCTFMNVMTSTNETSDEALNRMVENTRIEKIMKKEEVCQYLQQEQQ